MLPDDEYRTPGQLIEALLDERGWTNRVLAVVLGAEETGLNKLIKGKRPVDAALALALGEVFEIPPERFLALQKAFDLAQARLVERPDPGRAARARLFGDLPISAMMKRGWLDATDVRDVRSIESALVKFFETDSIQQIEILPHAAKKTHVSVDVTPAQLTWLYRVQQIARRSIVPAYSEEALRESLSKLKPLMASPETVSKVPRILSECGVRFVVVECLPRSKIDGVCFWLGNGSQPVIGMSVRFDRIDNFWFVLRHEIEHVLRRHGVAAAMMDTDLDMASSESIPEEEQQANEAASDFCIPKAKMDSFVARKAPFFSEQDLLGFSKLLHVHPGIAAGQLRNRIQKYNLFTEFLVKIRAHIVTTAVVDGWGACYPM